MGENYLKEAEKIMRSLLTDWQKLDAICCFVRPKLEYVIRTMLPMCGWAKNLDDAVRRMAKAAFQLPRRTTTPFFYAPWKYGGLGLPNVESDLDCTWASQVFKYLTTKDPKVVIICARRLRDMIVARTAVKAATFDEVLYFLNSQPDELEHCRSHNVRSLFSLVHGNFHHLGAVLTAAEGGMVELKIGETTVRGVESRKSSPLLRSHAVPPETVAITDSC